jgi:hypothetical protein
MPVFYFFFYFFFFASLGQSMAACEEGGAIITAWANPFLAPQVKALAG